MAERRLQLDSARQISLETTLADLLIIVVDVKQVGEQARVQSEFFTCGILRSFGL